MVNERHEGKELQDKTKKVEKSDEAGEIISEFECSKKSKTRNIVQLARFLTVRLTFFSIAYLQPAFPHRNFSNDFLNVWLSFFNIAYWHN